MIGLLPEHRVDDRCGGLRLLLHDQQQGLSKQQPGCCREAWPALRRAPRSPRRTARSPPAGSTSRHTARTFWQHHLNFLSLPHGQGEYGSARAIVISPWESICGAGILGATLAKSPVPASMLMPVRRGLPTPPDEAVAARSPRRSGRGSGLAHRRVPRDEDCTVASGGRHVRTTARAGLAVGRPVPAGSAPAGRHARPGGRPRAAGPGLGPHGAPGLDASRRDSADAAGPGRDSRAARAGRVAGRRLDLGRREQPDHPRQRGLALRQRADLGPPLHPPRLQQQLRRLAARGVPQGPGRPPRPGPAGRWPCATWCIWWRMRTSRCTWAIAATAGATTSSSSSSATITRTCTRSGIPACFASATATSASSWTT